jgi:NAD+ synthase
MSQADRIATWLRAYAARAGAEGYVIGLSGGVDSAVTAALCQRAVGDRVQGILLPCHSVVEDAEMACLVARALDLRTVTVDLSTTYDSLLSALPIDLSVMARANIKPRLRMVTLYAFANARNYLVAGTGNKSELMVGYFTKYGDGAVDVEPLGNLYKWQVRQLAHELGVPRAVIDRPPSAGLWVGQTDEDELGMSYEDLDAALAAIELGRTSSLDPALVDRVQWLITASKHKRAVPPICPVDAG